VFISQRLGVSDKSILLSADETNTVTAPGTPAAVTSGPKRNLLRAVVVFK